MPQTHAGVQEGQTVQQPENLRIHYIQRRFSGTRTLEQALVTLMKAHS